MSDSFWGNITNPLEQEGHLNSKEVHTFIETLTTLGDLVTNSLFATFHVDTLEEHPYSEPVEFESAVAEANYIRFELVVSEDACCQPRLLYANEVL